MKDCEGCPPESVDEIMAKNKIVDEENVVIDHLIAALKALDEMEPESEQYRAIHSKIRAVIEYTKARI